MIPRYTRPQAAAIWAPENRYRIWFEIEALACEGMAETGAIPREAAAAIRAAGGAAMANFSTADTDRIDEIERETRHDVIAFLTWLAPHIGEDSRFVHQGLTSSDILDTCLAVMQVLHEGLADSKYRPCPLLVKYVEAGWLGRKTQRGFYDYRGETPIPTR